MSDAFKTILKAILFVTVVVGVWGANGFQMPDMPDFSGPQAPEHILSLVVALLFAVLGIAAFYTKADCAARYGVLLLLGGLLIVGSGLDRGAVVLACVLLGGAVIIAQVPWHMMGWLIGIRPPTHMASFYDSVAVALRSGVALPDALDLWAADQRRFWLPRKIRRIAAAVRNGQALSSAMARFPATFPKHDRAIIEAGEQADCMPEAFDQCYRIARIPLFQNIPIGIFLAEVVVCTLVVTFILIVIMPKFADIYSQLGGELPYLTQVMVDVSWLLSHRFIWLVFGAMLLVAVWRLLRALPAVVGPIHALCPWLRAMSWELPLSRFSFVAGAMLRAGRPVDETLYLAITASDHPILDRVRSRVVGAVNAGQPLDAAIGLVKTLPADFKWYVANGVKRETPEQVLLFLSKSYCEEHQVRLVALGSLLTPLFSILLGGAALFFVLSLYLPIFNIPKMVGYE